MDLAHPGQHQPQAQLPQQPPQQLPQQLPQAQLPQQLPQQLHQPVLADEQELCLIDADEQPDSSGTTQQQQQRHALEQDTNKLPLLVLAAEVAPGPSHSPFDSEQPQLQSAELGSHEACLSPADGSEDVQAHTHMVSELCLRRQHCHDESGPGEEEQVADTVSLANSPQAYAVEQLGSGLRGASEGVLIEVCFCLVRHQYTQVKESIRNKGTPQACCT